jgi:hypothetical protein
MAIPDTYELKLLVTPHARDSAGKGHVGHDRHMIETGEGEYAADRSAMEAILSWKIL